MDFFVKAISDVYYYVYYYVLLKAIYVLLTPRNVARAFRWRISYIAHHYT